jgi:hypothetical protein
MCHVRAFRAIGEQTWNSTLKLAWHGDVSKPGFGQPPAGLEAWVMQTCRDGSVRLVLVLTFALLLIEAEQVHAHDDLTWRMLSSGDVSRAEWFETLRTPSGAPCCSLSDCRQTQAEWRGDTEGWWALVAGSWRPIPADKVLASPRSIDGAAYLCIAKGTHDGGDMFGRITTMLSPIYCFVPPDLGS